MDELFIELVCLGGPYNGQRVRVPSTETRITPAMIAGGDVGTLPEPAFGEGYYSPQDREFGGQTVRVLRWEGEL